MEWEIRNGHLCCFPGVGRHLMHLLLFCKELFCKGVAQGWPFLTVPLLPLTSSSSTVFGKFQLKSKLIKWKIARFWVQTHRYIYCVCVCVCVPANPFQLHHHHYHLRNSSNNNNASWQCKQKAARKKKNKKSEEGRQCKTRSSEFKDLEPDETGFRFRFRLRPVI